MKVNVTALFTTAQVELITAAVKDGAPSLHLGVRRADRRRRRRSGADHGALGRHHARRAALRADLGVPARDPQRRPGRSGRLPHHHGDPRPARRSSTRSARTSTSSRSRPCRCSTATPSRPGSRSKSMKRALRHRRGRVHRQHPRRPAARGRRRGRRSSTTSAPGAASSSPSCSSGPGTRLVEGDVLDQALLEEAFEGCDRVFHLQANADVRHGLEHPRRDLEQNTIATATVLEAMRAVGTYARSRSRRPARSTASPRSSRRPRTRRSRCRPRSTRPRSSPARA